MKQTRSTRRHATANTSPILVRLRGELSRRRWRSLQRREWGWIMKPGPLVTHAPAMLEPCVAADPGRPPVTPCRKCGSLGCGPFRCRFDTGREEERQSPADSSRDQASKPGEDGKPPGSPPGKTAH